jgi:hypothetical protein
MTREELEQIIKKYRNRSNKLYPEHEAKSYQCAQFADWVEDNIDTFEDVDDFASDEEELWDNFLESKEESENWDSMFPNGDEDDSITDWMTKD